MLLLLQLPQGQDLPSDLSAWLTEQNLSAGLPTHELDEGSVNLSFRANYQLYTIIGLESYISGTLVCYTPVAVVQVSDWICCYRSWPLTS